jgi:hypothetical protein
MVELGRPVRVLSMTRKARKARMKRALRLVLIRG